MKRRDFLAAAALAPALRPPRPVPGKIDCQSHLFPPEILEILGKRGTGPRLVRRGDERIVLVGGWERKVFPHHCDPVAKLAAMDASGIELAALSINDPGPERFGAEGPAIARLQNDFIAGVARRHPGRFLPLAVLPLLQMDAALQELDRCAERLGMRGILLYSNLDGRFPDEPEFRPLFRRAEAMNLPVLLHPAFPVTFDAVQGYEMTSGLGLMFDTTIALTRLLLSGLLDECPRLRLVCPHAGGTLPYLLGRVEHQTSVLKRGGQKLRKPFGEYLRQVWLDAVTPHPVPLRCALDLVGAGRMLYSSDHPWVDPALIVRTVDAVGLSDRDRDAVYRNNAKELFGL
jgi:predicted TIM-barrel fold metal-dependent hydrolase